MRFAYCALQSRPLPHLLQLLGQRVGPLRDVAGAEAHDIVAAPGDALIRPASCWESSCAITWRCPRARRGHQRVAVGAFDRRFAGRIDMRDDHGVGVAEAGAELVEQRRENRRPRDSRVMFACLASSPPIQPEAHAENDQRQGEIGVDFKRGHDRRLRSMARPMKCRTAPTKSQPIENPIKVQPNE